MFERPIVLSTDNQLNIKCLQNLTLSEHLMVINKLLNDHYANVNPKVAINLIIPQKQKMLEEKKRIRAQLIENFPALEKIKTFEEFIDPQKIHPILSQHVKQIYFTASTNYYDKVTQQNLSTRVSKESISVASVYPLLICPYLLDDDHIKLPVMEPSERKETVLQLFSLSISQLKLRIKKSTLPLEDFVNTGLLPLMLLSQKVNSFLTFSPQQAHIQIVPILAEFAKSLEWTLTGILAKEKVAKLDDQESQIAKLYTAIITDQLYLLYLYISEVIAYQENSIPEDLNYAEWCSDKFYEYHLFGEKDILHKHNILKKEAEINATKHKQKLSLRYFLNRTLIEAKRDSLDLSVSFYEDFLSLIEQDPTALQHAEMSRCYACLALILKKAQNKPDLFLLHTGSLFQRTINILSQKPDFINYRELILLAKKQKFEQFSYILNNALKQYSPIQPQYDLVQNSFTFSLSQDFFIKKSKKMNKNPAWFENVIFDLKKNTITIIIKDTFLSLTSPDNFQDIRTVANYLSRNIQKKQVAQPKPVLKKQSTTVTPVAVTSITENVMAETTTLSTIHKPHSEQSPPIKLTPVENEKTTQANQLKELEDKISQLSLKESRDKEKSTPISSSISTTEKIKVTSEKKSDAKKETKSPEKSEKKSEPEPKILTAKEVGLTHFPDNIVTPVYFGFNQKKKSTNTYAIWDEVPNLSGEAEDHFKAMLDPRGITVAKNIDDAGVKIICPSGKRNNPLCTFMYAKSRSKLHGSLRIDAKFEEEATSILPENEGQPIFSYVFGKVRHK